MRLSRSDTQEVASRVAGLATLAIGDTQLGGLPVRVEDQIEELLGNEFEQLIGRLEFTPDGVFLFPKEGLAVVEHPSPVTQ